VVHQYGYGRGDDATHEHRQHPRPKMSFRQSSSGSQTYPPVMEENEEDQEKNEYEYGLPPHPAPLKNRPSVQKYYSDPYAQSPNARPKLESSDSKSSTHSLKGFGGIFNFSHSADPSRAGMTSPISAGQGDARGGAHRGTKDYPHLPKREKDVEREERRGLVLDTDGHDEGEDGGDGEGGDISGRMSYDEEPRSAVTEESIGHVMRAERWTPLGGVLQERTEGDGGVVSPAGNGIGQASGGRTSSGVGGPRGPRGPGGR
jgi:hypothetical protein